jgi:DNA-directed RNA polymerase alpha subunit
MGRYFEQVSAEMIRSKDESLYATIDCTYLQAIRYTYMSAMDVPTLMYGEPPFLKQLVWLVFEDETRRVNGDIESLNVSEIVDRMHQHIHYKKIMDIGVLNYVYEKEHEDIKRKNMKNTDIRYVGFSLRTYRSLYKYGICTLGDIIKYTKEDLEKIRNLGVKGIEEIEAVLAKHGLELTPSKECENVDEMSLEELDLSLRSFNILIRNNIRTIGDLRNADIEDLRKLRGMGEKSISEIIDKLEGLKR